MNQHAAAKASDVKLAVLPMGGQRQQVFDAVTDGYFVVNRDYNNPDLKRKSGRGSGNSADWEPSDSRQLKDLIEKWKADKEGRDVVIKKPWAPACALSPVGKAIRDHDGAIMMRDKDKNTWQVIAGGRTLVRFKGVFREYDGWSPMPADHTFVNTDLTADRDTYQLDQTPDGMPRKARPQYTSPNAPRAEINVTIIEAAGNVAKALSDAMQFANEAERGDLIKELTRVSSAMRWNMRTDRHKFE